ncbi:hypothetical protein C7212DRAFT_357529 [Tuber magnatum]|uniref:Uncharacterized protein n=1 Tax=Tuber magnatum TaxID=42249 RepID=A0A317SR03_9PEZI|nr:hypothetical protein C7212DRAFT_357529 [Tuber magnatum]
MNWTGGTRNRAIRASTTSRLQKRYFAKVRAAAQTFAAPSSQGNLPHAFKRKRRTTPEFDIVVKKARTDYEETDRRGSSPLLHIDKGAGKRGGMEMEEDIRKARRRLLLEREDWVCTTLSKPLILKSREEIRKLKNFHREATETGSSGSTSSQEDGDSDDDDDSDDDGDYDDSSTLRNDDKQGTASIAHENRRRVIPREDTPELPEYPEHEDIYIRIGGSTQRSSASATNPTGPAESASRSAEISSTTIRGSSVDTMLLDFYKHEPMFQFQHITPAVSEIVERKRREARQSGYSSSPLARYSRLKGNRVPGLLDGGPGEVNEDDQLIKEVERASSSIPSGSVYSTIVLRDSPSAHGKECLCSRAEGAMGYDFCRIASIETPIDEKVREEETLGHTHLANATFGSSQVSWSTSPAERRPYQHQREQTFDEIASVIISSENLLNLESFVGSGNGTQTRVSVIQNTERDIHEAAQEDEEGGRDESPGIQSSDDSVTEGVVESEVEESEMEIGRDDHSLGDNQESAGPVSPDSGEDNMKDAQESTDREWDEESTTATREDTGEILDTIYVASTIAYGESARAIGTALLHKIALAKPNTT